MSVDTKNLCLIDANPQPDLAAAASREACLLRLARDNCQLLVNAIFQLPSVMDSEGHSAALLPKTGLVALPREKAIPKAKAPTTWEAFARKKGITKHKHSRLTYSDQAGEYLPTHGMGSAVNRQLSDWCCEVPVGGDAFADQFGEGRAAKRARQASNAARERKNKNIKK